MLVALTWIQIVGAGANRIAVPETGHDLEIVVWLEAHPNARRGDGIDRATDGDVV